MHTQVMVEARQRYLAEFRKRSAGGHFHIEPALRTTRGEVAVEGALQLPVRVDLISKTEGLTTAVSTPTPRPAVRASYAVGGVLVTIDSPAWDALSIRLHNCAPVNFAALKTWFGSWFDQEDRNELNEEGSYGVVHFLADPKRIGSDCVLTLDLGSAPIDAFKQLIVVLAGYQPTRVEITAS